MDRDKVLQALNCCEGHDSHCWAMNPKCPYWREDDKHANYGFPRCFDDMKEDVFALLKEQDNEKKRIMKVIWDTLHEGLSIDTVADQDWVYEQIRHKIEGT